MAGLLIGFDSSAQPMDPDVEHMLTVVGVRERGWQVLGPHVWPNRNHPGARHACWLWFRGLAPQQNGAAVASVDEGDGVTSPASTDGPLLERRGLIVYINDPNTRISTHGNPACPFIRSHGKDGQRVVEITLETLGQELQRFAHGEHRWAANPQGNDMWVRIDLGDSELERAVLNYIHCRLAERHAPFGRTTIERHCREGGV